MPFSPLSSLSLLHLSTLPQVPVLSLYLSPCALRPPGLSSKPQTEIKPPPLSRGTMQPLLNSAEQGSMGIPGIQLVLRSALGCKQKATDLVLVQCLQDTGQQATDSSIQALGDGAAEMCPLVSGPASRWALLLTQGQKASRGVNKHTQGSYATPHGALGPLRPFS